MAGAIEKKINEELDSIKDSPNNYIDARAGILDDVALSREFAQTRLEAICKRFTGGLNDEGIGEDFTLAEICENLAKQRAVCYGARDLVGAVRKFVFPDFETANGPLDLTEPTTSTFGIKATDILEENTILLQDTAGTQTINGNTFSIKLTDYYLVRSRVDGELIDISKNTKPYSTPNADIPFGNAIAWVTGTGGDVSGELEANTWNYHNARANLASITTYNSGVWDEVTVVTLADTLTQGSNTDYTPVGPGFGQKYYLKRHEEYINTFTITGTTTTAGVEITGISNPDIALIKYGDVISGTGIPEGANGAPTIAAVQSAGNKIRIGTIIQTTGTVGQAANVVTLSGGTWPTNLSRGSTVTISGGGGKVEIINSNTQVTLDNSATVSTGTNYSLEYVGLATADGTITITVNSVPFGFGAHDIFCQAEVVAEGLVKNDDWKPAGDGIGGYGGTNEGPDDQLVANTKNFISLLGFFDPDNGDPSTPPNNDLTLSARGDISSEGKEYSGIYYPNIERNPMKPAVGGTNKPYATDTGEIIGTQPTGFTDMDLHTGRYVRFDHKRADEVGALPEHRYVTDTAEKWYYELQSTGTYVCGTVTVDAFPMPNAEEPPGEIDKTGLSQCITQAQSTTIAVPEVTSGGAQYAASGDIDASNPFTPPASGSVTDTLPADDNTTPAATTGTWTWGSTSGSWNNQPPDADDTIGSYFTLVDNYIIVNRFHWETVSYTLLGAPASAPSTQAHDGTTWAGTYGTDSSAFKCTYNFAQRHIYDADGTDDTFMNADTGFIQSTVETLQTLMKFRDPISTGTVGSGGITDSDFEDYIETTNSTGFDVDLSNIQAKLKQYRNAFTNQHRSGALNNGAQVGPAIAFDLTSNQWDAFSSELGTLNTRCGERVAEVNNRIGVPTRAGALARPTARGTPPAIYVDTIPSSPALGAYVPYGRSLYNNCNYILGSDLNLLGNLIKDIQSLGDLIDIVKKARNRYELYNGRDKEYTDV